MNNFTVQALKKEQIDEVAALIAKGYENDKFFAWVVENEEDRHEIVTNYYKAYLSVEGCVSHVASSDNGTIIGATVWLPHDVDASLYETINDAVGPYVATFQEVADRSHENEPSAFDFYQLVGIVVKQEFRELGVGRELLSTFLTELDERKIATYLEASTPYTGGGVYGKFNYRPYGERMVFAPGAVLYPLYRPVGGIFENA